MKGINWTSRAVHTLIQNKPTRLKAQLCEDVARIRKHLYVQTKDVAHALDSQNRMREYLH